MGEVMMRMIVMYERITIKSKDISVIRPSDTMPSSDMPHNDTIFSSEVL